MPVLTSVVDDVHQWETLTGKSAQFQDRITVLGFWGEDLSNKKGDALNLNQKIYKRFYQFKDFHFVMVVKQGYQAQVEELKEELKAGVGTDLIKWRFVFGNDDQIASLFDSLKTPLQLSNKYSLPYVFIIDKELNLRGRDDDEDGGNFWFQCSVSWLKSIIKWSMTSSRILAEYRRAWKKYNKNTTP